MELITDGGRRIDRQAELAALVNRPFKALSDQDRQRIIDLLNWDHQQRQKRRFLENISERRIRIYQQPNNKA